MRYLVPLIVVIIFAVVALGLWSNRTPKPQKLKRYSPEYRELLKLRELKDNLQSLAAEAYEQPLGTQVIDEIKIHNAAVRREIGG